SSGYGFGMVDILPARTKSSQIRNQPNRGQAQPSSLGQLADREQIGVFVHGINLHLPPTVRSTRNTSHQLGRRSLARYCSL
ncbi:hypothetical protein, partial [Nocardia tengchongensis]|uniref:hypothetical protein n=1 Tax=Nocardia tengchongensis TaxID=2055889 RepID=UPI00364ECB98